jgi:nitrate/nitrite-specific signal transduction histidine kinase
MLIEGAAVDLELENRRLRAELHAQTQELRGSRARLVAAGDAERRRLERDLHDGRLPVAVETAAYFAVSEALANVVKHAGAGLVAVDVRVQRGRLEIDVNDDGCGGASPDGGSGLSGLADRIGALDGRVEIESPPGAGTRVHVAIPLSRPAASPPLRSQPVISGPCRRFLRGA